MSAQGKVISITELPPEFIERLSHAPGSILGGTSSLGTLAGCSTEAFADQVIEFIEMEESIQEAPFDRYADLSGLTHIRIGIDHLIHTARRRRKVKQPAKSALFADNPMTFGVAHSYELLMSDAMVEVRAFKERRAATQWLEVPLKTLECPL